MGMSSKNLLTHNSGGLKLNKFNYDEKEQLRTRLAILESQLNVANRETNNLKVKNEQLNKIVQQYGILYSSL